MTLKYHVDKLAALLAEPRPGNPNWNNEVATHWEGIALLWAALCPAKEGSPA